VKPVLPFLLLVAGMACGSDAISDQPTAMERGGSGENSGGSSGGGPGGIGREAEDTGPSDGPDVTYDDGGRSAEPDGDVAMDDAGTIPPGPTNYGGVGEKIPIPLQHTPVPVPPVIPPECPDDPTQGFTEYQDTFVVQRPYDLPAAARFSYEDGIYTFWVNSNDKPHEPGNTTAPRTEARYTNYAIGEHLWSADVLLDSPLNRTCIMQIHNVVGAIAVYLRVVDGRMFNLTTGKTILTDSYGKWFNLKVAFDTQTLQVRTFVNNCLKETSHAPHGPTPNWYFKNGVYTCDSGTCRDHYKNVHLYQKD
jgi:hypothetical protein